MEIKTEVHLFKSQSKYKNKTSIQNFDKLQIAVQFIKQIKFTILVEIRN